MNVKDLLAEVVQEPENQKFVVQVLGLIVAVFAPIKEVLFSVGFLLVADLVTGVMAARKKGQKIESSKLRRSVTKSATYLLAVCSAYITQKYLLSDSIPIVPVVAAMIGGTELLSLYENLSVLSGIPLADKIKDILQPPKPEDQPSSSLPEDKERE